jgi:heptose I phosphotransferase
MEWHWSHVCWSTADAPSSTREVLSLQPQDRYHAKQGRSTGRWVLGSGKRTLRVFIKRHHELPWRLRLAATLWPKAGWSPSWHEYRQLDWARQKGIAVPEPIAVGEQIGPGFRLQSYLAVAELSGMIPLHEAVGLAARTLEPTAFVSWKRSCIREMAIMVRRLHGHFRYHKDLYLCHFFVEPPSKHRGEVTSGSLHLIDLHRMREHRFLGWYFRIKDLAQLLYSTAEVPEIDDRDRLRFLRTYCGGKISRWLLAAVMAKAHRYLRHNRKARTPFPSSVLLGTSRATKARSA